MLLKPSNNTPVIAAELVRLCIEAGFPPGVFNLVTGRGSEVGERLIASPQIDFIAFTGSMEVGLPASLLRWPHLELPSSTVGADIKLLKEVHLPQQQRNFVRAGHAKTSRTGANSATRADTRSARAS